MLTKNRTLHFNFLAVIDLFTLFFVIGLPRIPGTNIPLAVLAIGLHSSSIIRFHRKFLSLACGFYYIFILFITIGIFSAEEFADKIFFLIQAGKILVSFYSGIVTAKIIYRFNKIIYLWILIQSTLIILSNFNTDIYMWLLSFTSNNSIDSFRSIFGIRALGFGLCHVDGAVSLVVMASLTFVFQIKRANYTNPIYNNIILAAGMALSLLISRSSLIPLSLLAIFKISTRNILLTTIAAITLFTTSSFISPESGATYHALELFRKIYTEKKFETNSTNRNIEMFILPDNISGYFIGDGRFFNTGDGFVSGFYKNTDLGWNRLLFFGGIPICIIFLILNNFWLLALKYFSVNNLTSYSYFLFSVFFIINFKGIFVSMFFTSLLFTFATTYMDKPFLIKKSSPTSPVLNND